MNNRISKLIHSIFNRNSKFEIRNFSGFTLIEVLLVVSLLLVLASSSIALYGSYYTSSQLNENTSETIQLIRLAQQRAIARFNNANHGVYVDITSGDDHVIIYQGPSYISRVTDFDIVLTFESAISLSTTIPGTEINFSKGLGEPSATGAILLTHDVHGSRTISINDKGVVEEE